MMMEEQSKKDLHIGDLPLEGKKEIMRDESSNAIDVETNNGSSIDGNSLPIAGEGGSTIMDFDSQKTKKIKRFRCFAVIIILLITIATAITLGIVLTRKKEGGGKAASTMQSSTTSASPPDDDYTSPMVPMTASPTRAPITPVVKTKFDKVKEYILNTGLSTSETLEKDDSPQTQAALYMAEDDDFEVPEGDANYRDSVIWNERYAMVVFFYSTGGLEWTNNYAFLAKGTSICDWGRTIASVRGWVRIGVGCNKQRRVSAMIFDKNNLSGSLPDELGFLSEMTFFSVTHNSISGTIPSRLSYWKNIEFLDLRRNAIEGKLPVWLDKLASLEALVLSENSLTGTIPSSFRGLTNLTYLYLEDNMLEGTLDNLEENTKLVTMYIENNAFAQKIDSTFLAKHKALVRIDISDNEFSGEVPVHLFSGGNLDILDVHGNQLSSFPDKISKLNNTLGFLALQFNPLKGPFPTDTISNVNRLRHLDLTSTSMTGTMPKELGDLTNLKYFFMAGTTFEAGPIPDEYQKLTTLDDLSLKKSGRTGKIPSWIGDLNKLMMLDLDSNDLTGTIPSELGNLQLLWLLFLHRNKLQGSVPEELGNLKLNNLLLDHNDITDGVQRLCEVLPGTRITSDCGQMSGEVQCECCSVCCDDEEEFAECTEHAENDYLALLEPQWEDNFSREDPINPFVSRYEFILRDFNITR